MAHITPQLHISFPFKETKYLYFKSYHNHLKKQIKNIMEEHPDADDFFVVRMKRDEWGEWCEHWKLINGKPEIVESGWS